MHHYIQVFRVFMLLNYNTNIGCLPFVYLNFHFRYLSVSSKTTRGSLFHNFRNPTTSVNFMKLLIVSVRSITTLILQSFLRRIAFYFSLLTMPRCRKNPKRCFVKFMRYIMEWRLSNYVKCDWHYFRWPLSAIATGFTFYLTITIW